MARITVEDCIDKFTSRFELVLVASNRARKLHSGEQPTVEKDNDKNTVIALREIANETISQEKLKDDLIEEYQTITFTEDELSEENMLEDKNITEEEEINIVSEEDIGENNTESKEEIEIQNPQQENNSVKIIEEN
tara:strand:- start:879 stop:1286 length:408 start_codon:yes stop_codon:yes gene_type:complete